MKTAPRQSRYGDEYPHVVRKNGRRSAWRSQIQVEVGPADAQVNARVRLAHPEPFDARGDLTAGARELLLAAAARAAIEGGLSACFVWGADSCTFVGPTGEPRDSDHPPLVKPFYVQLGAKLPPLRLERCFVIALPSEKGAEERFLCAQRIGRLVEIVEGEHMVLGHLPDDEIPSDSDGMEVPDEQVLRLLPKTYRGAQITGYLCGGILGPVQPAELAQPIILNDPWPHEVAQACEEVAGHPLALDIIEAVWDAVRERRPALLRAA
jgi:hypothetical protein